MSFTSQASNRPSGSATTSTMADKASAFADKAGEKLDETVDSASAAANRVAEHTREATERVNEVAGHLKSAIDKSVSEQPMTTLVLAAAVGFVVGAIWKS